MTDAPHDHATEEAVLACAMLRSEALDGLATQASPEWFHDATHRKIFGAMVELHRESVVPDPVTIAGKLAATNGDAMALKVRVASLDAALPDADRWETYFAEAQALARRRRLIDVCRETALRITRGDDEAGTVQALQAELASLEDQAVQPQWSPIGEVLEETAEEVLAPDSESLPGITTGYKDLDAYLHPLQRGQFVVLCGRSSMGKSVAAVQIAVHAARQGKIVAYVSLEMTKLELGRRIYSSEARVDHDRLQRRMVSQREREQIIAVQRELRGLNLHIDDTASLTASDVAARLRKVQRERGGLDLAVVDHMQLLNPVRRTGSAAQEMKETANELRAMAKTLNCTVLALSQLSLIYRERAYKGPILSDLKESGAIGENAHVVLGVYRQELDEPKREDLWGLGELIILKQRGGRLTTAEMVWDGPHVSFRDMYREAQ